MNENNLLTILVKRHLSGKKKTPTFLVLLLGFIFSQSGTFHSLFWGSKNFASTLLDSYLGTVNSTDKVQISKTEDKFNYLQMGVNRKKNVTQRC